MVLYILQNVAKTTLSHLKCLSFSYLALYVAGAPAGNQADGPQDLKASQVKPRSAVLSWKPPNSAFTSYKLSYYTNGQDIKVRFTLIF